MSRARPKTFVIGARGFLGRHAVRAMAADFDVIKGVRASAEKALAEKMPAQEVDEIGIDITQLSSVNRAFEQAKPEIVLLLAAISDIDQCEQNPEEATAVNVRGAEHVVNACRRINARLLFTSTGAVFDGRKHGYTEEDMPSPISVYGKTKTQAEAKVLELGWSAIIVRIALAIGFAVENFEQHDRTVAVRRGRDQSGLQFLHAGAKIPPALYRAATGTGATKGASRH